MSTHFLFERDQNRGIALGLFLHSHTDKESPVVCQRQVPLVQLGCVDNGCREPGQFPVVIFVTVDDGSQLLLICILSANNWGITPFVWGLWCTARTACGGMWYSAVCAATTTPPTSSHVFHKAASNFFSNIKSNLER